MRFAVSQRRKRLLCATAGAFALCAALPGTGFWARHTVTRTTAAIVRSAQSSDDDSDDWRSRAQAFRLQSERNRIAAARTPNDFPVQLAACIASVPDDYAGFAMNDNGTVRPLSTAERYPPRDTGDLRNERIVRKLQNLASRFDRNPSYHAAILRYLSFSAVRLNNRSDEAVLYEAEKAEAIRRAFGGPQPAPEIVALWHKAAQTGERLEQQNAFFPFMDAIALYAERRDNEARDALHRASEKSDYDDYAFDEASGYARLRAAEGATLTGVDRVIALQNLSLPQYGRLRACARLAVAQAVETELHNRTDAGFRVRQDVRRLGTIMRENAVTIAGARNGSAIAILTRLRPGGAPVETFKFFPSVPAGVAPGDGDGPPPPDETNVSEEKSSEPEETAQDKWENAQNERYAAYLRRIGHANEAQAYAAEVAAQKNNQRLIEQISDNPNYYFYMPRLFLLQALPPLARLLLLNALFLLVLGGIAQRLARTRRIASDQPLPRAVRLGITSAFVLPLLGMLLVVGVDEFWDWAGPEGVFIGTSGCVAVAVLVRYGLMRRARSAQNRAPRKASLLTRCRTAGVRGVARTVGLWTLGLVCTYLLAAFLGFACSWFFDIGLTSVADGEINAFELVTQTAQFTTFWTLAVCILGTPTLLLLFFAACSPKVGIPALAGIVRGMRGLAVPVACGFVLLTVPLFVWLACADANLNHDIDRAMQNQNRYIAEISRK